MFAMIDPRVETDVSALITVSITSWNGTIAQARLRPGAVPLRWITKETSNR